MSLFCREVKRSLYGKCLDANTNPDRLDFFIEDMFAMMNSNTAEYPLERLLTMLMQEDFHTAVFGQYRNYLT